ncbi:unnamed protein product, partial [Gadus morhua 'NCC']
MRTHVLLLLALLAGAVTGAREKSQLGTADRLRTKREIPTGVALRNTGSSIYKRSQDATKVSITKSDQLLSIGDQDFTMRPNFG